MSNIVNIAALAKRLKSLLTHGGFEADDESDGKRTNYTDFGWADVRTGTAKRVIPTLSRYH